MLLRLLPHQKSNAGRLKGACGSWCAKTPIGGNRQTCPIILVRQITTDSQVSVGILGIMATFSTACKLFAGCRQCGGLSSIKPVVTFRQQAPQRTPHRRRGRVASRPREARSPRVRDHQRAPGRVAFKFFLAAQAAQVPPADPRRVAGLAHDLDGVATGRRVVLAIAAEPGSQPGGRRSNGVRCAAALV